MQAAGHGRKHSGSMDVGHPLPQPPLVAQFQQPGSVLAGGIEQDALGTRRGSSRHHQFRRRGSDAPVVRVRDGNQRSVGGRRAGLRRTDHRQDTVFASESGKPDLDEHGTSSGECVGPLLD
jgi:hypothetical protein